MNVIVIGGGASGVFSAINLARRGFSVKILERSDRILKKLLTTGNGRCNLTNTFINSSCYNTDFVNEALNKYNNNYFLEFLNSIGIRTTVENIDRVYPVTLKASSVVNLLLEELESLNVECIVNTKVNRILKTKKNFKIITSKDEYYADKIIFAVGGAAAPVFGTDGSSYKILEEIGHKKTNIYPALTQINLDFNYLKAFSGVKVKGNVKLFEDEKLVDFSSGEILFTNYGLSGPPILDISKSVNIFSGNKNIIMPLINNIENEKSLVEELYNRYYILSHYSLERWLSGLVDKKFIPYIAKKLKLSLDYSMNLVDKKTFAKLINLLIRSEFKVLSTRGFDNSQVTSGGIEICDVDNITMQSKIVEGLYIIGEVLDVDGKCGGYNLQWAFSSAMAASFSI